MPFIPITPPITDPVAYATSGQRAVGDPFLDPANQLNTVTDAMFEQMAWLRDWAETELVNAIDLIEQITRVPNSITVPTPVPLPEIDLTPDWEPIILNPVTVADFGQVDDFPVFAPIETGTLPSISAVHIDPFDPTPVNIVIPPAPNPAILREPDDPPLNPGFTYPDVLPIHLPDDPVLANVEIPVFVPPTLPTFDPTYPQFQDQAVNPLISWTEPTYSREVIDGVIVQINTFLVGGSGINPDVEEAIYFRGRDRDSRAIRQQVQQATDEWAGKGYTAPPGMLVQRLDAIRDDGLIKALGFNREMTIKVFDTEIENLRFAVQQGIAAEQLFVQMFLAAAERLFEVQKLYVQWSIELYNLQVTIFNAKMQEVNIRLQVFEAQIRTKLAEIEIFKARIDVARVTAEVNKVVVEAYTAQVQAQIAIVEIYTAQVGAVKVQADVYATEIDAYKATVDAFASRVSADKLRFDAYDSRIRGEIGKASITEAEARAYAAEVEGISAGVRAEVAALEGAVSKIQVEIQAQVAGIGAATAKSQNQLEQIQSRVAGYTADTQRYIAQASEEEAKAKVDLAAWAAENSIALEFFNTQLQQFSVTRNEILENAKIALQALTSAAQLSTTIGAGALAAMNVGVSLSGGASVGTSGSDSISTSYSHSESASRSATMSFEADNEDPLNTFVAEVTL